MTNTKKTEEPKKVEEPKKEEKVSSTEAKTQLFVAEVEKKEFLDNMEICIKEFGGISNIPHKHPYWDWANKFRSL